jgi:hypothetical protein
MSTRPLRAILRRALPFAVRWRVCNLRRALGDRRDRMPFATARGESAAFPHRLCVYSLPVACYPGQEARFAGKRRNLELALGAIDGVVVRPGEVFSFWRSVGRPTRGSGYAPAAALKRGQLTEEVGGSICLASTLVYNAGLLSAMEVVERYCHSVDSYGTARYFELGRDAAVEYAYRDLRLRNTLPHRIMLRARLEDGMAVAEAYAQCAVDLRVSIAVGEPAYTTAPAVRVIDRRLRELCVIDDAGSDGIDVQTRRTVWLAGVRRDDDLGWSHHEHRPRRERWVPDAATEAAT